MSINKGLKLQRTESSMVWLGEKDLRLYKHELIEDLLRDTTAYYKQAARNWSNTINLYEFVKEANSHLTFENENSDFMF